MQPELDSHETDSNAEGTDFSAYFKLLGTIDSSPMFREEEFAVASEFKRTGNLQLREKLINHNLRFVVKIALEYRHYGFSLNDLVQEGNGGLVRAANSFNPERGYRFISYAIWWIRAYIQEYILRNWSLVKIGTTQKQRKVFNRHQRGKGINLEVFTEETGMAPDEAERIVDRIEARDTSLNEPIQRKDGGDGEKSTLQDFLQDRENGDPQAALDVESCRASMHALVHGALSTLTDREKFVIERRHLTEDCITLRELSGELRISKERVRQVEAKALGKIRAYIQGKMNGGIKDLFQY